MIRRTKRIGALLLALVMVFSLFPAGAFALDELPVEEPEEQQVEQPVQQEDIPVSQDGDEGLPQAAQNQPDAPKVMLTNTNAADLTQGGEGGEGGEGNGNDPTTPPTEGSQGKNTIQFVNWDDSLLLELHVDDGVVPAYTGEAPTKAASESEVYTFAGWDAEIVAAAGNATYKATYTAATRQYTVRFLNGETVLSSAQYDYGTLAASIALPAEDPIKAEDAQYTTYTFKGWDPAVADVTADADYIAQFEGSGLKSYTVKFVNGDSTLQEKTLDYGTMPAYDQDTNGVPSKAEDAQFASYTFTGWDPEVAEVTGEATYTAQFEGSGLKSYIVTFMDGETVLEGLGGSYDYGTVLELPAVPAEEGYRGEWRLDGQAVTSVTVQDNVTLTAVYIPVSTVIFVDRDGDTISEETVDNGTVISMPAVIEREDYIAYWATGTASHGQDAGFKPDEGGRIGKEGDTYTVSKDVTIGPDYDPLTYTVTFYREDKETVVATKTVDARTSYCLNDIPAVTVKDGYLGYWAYSGGEFTNSVKVTADTSVWEAYNQTVVTVTFMIDEESVHDTMTVDKGHAIGTLPADPVVEGKEFVKWVDENGNDVTGATEVTRDMTVTAVFNDAYYVSFVVEKEGGTAERLFQYFRTQGEAIGTLPEAPFVAGKVFEKWVNQATGEEVTADTIVNGNIIAEAVFSEITVYNITVEYYYLNDGGGEVVFNTDLLQVEEHEIPYTITAPATTQTSPDEVAGAPIYYPATPTVKVNKADFDAQLKATVRIKYVPYTAEYDFVYKLKDLTGDGYTEIPNTKEHIYGVLNSYVTPTVKNFDYAVLELAEGATITEASGQVLEVKYTRRNYQLTYETNGGSYVPGVTAPYETVVTLPAGTTGENPVPTREGYTFAGWYLDEDLTEAAEATVKIIGDTTIYAKWEGKTVNYTIVYMKEVYNNATGTTSFVYENSREASGKVGTTVYAAGAPAITLNGYEKLESINGTETAGGTGEDTAITIAPDGSTVLKVYYSLIRYTLVFNLNRNTGRITMDGETYTGSNYQITDVVLGQDVSSMWPATSNEVYASDRYFGGWTGASGTYLTKRYELIYDNVRNANANHVQTYTASWDNSSYDRNAYYWLQQPDGTYVIYDPYTQTGLNTNNLGAKDIDGYTKHSGTPSGYSGSGNQISSVSEYNWGDYVQDDNRSGGTGYTYYEYNGHLYRERDTSWWGNIDTGKTRYSVTFKYSYNFYYDRAKYKIDYYFGSSLLSTKSNIFFEADISGAEYDYTPAKPANTSTIDYSDYTWGGWYADAGLQTPYTFDTMPGHNLALYAKWVAPTFTVNFDLQGGGATADFPSQTLEKYKMVSKPGTNPTKAGYIFDGWYTSAAGSTLYDWNNQITANTTIYAHWRF